MYVQCTMNEIFQIKFHKGRLQKEVIEGGWSMGAFNHFQTIPDNKTVSCIVQTKKWSYIQNKLTSDKKNTSLSLPLLCFDI